jgi:hypothetical protein
MIWKLKNLIKIIGKVIGVILMTLLLLVITFICEKDCKIVQYKQKQERKYVPNFFLR